MRQGAEAYTLVTPEDRFVLWATGGREDLPWRLYCGEKIEQPYFERRVEELKSQGYRVVPTLVCERPAPAAAPPPGTEENDG